MTIENIWSYMDLIQDHIASFWLSFPIYSWKPIKVPSWVYWYFRLENNSVSVADDSIGTLQKEATFDFVISSWNKSTPDSDMYENINTLSNVLVIESGDRITLPWGFVIYSIQEWSQSGVLRDISENPYIIWQYIFRYKYRYVSKPRL